MKPSKLSNNFTGGSSEAPRLKGRVKRNKATGGNALDLGVLFDDTKFGRKIQVTLKNNDSANHHIALFAGMLKTVDEIAAVAGVSVDAIASNGVVLGTSSDQKLVCSCKNLEVIQRYIQEHPTRILSLQLSTDDESQWYLPITISKFDITRTLGSEEIMPSGYLKPSSPNAKLVVIDDIKHFQVDDRTILDFVVGAGRQLQISIELGESIDSAVTLDESAQNLL